jgi:hypothetical protein
MTALAMLRTTESVVVTGADAGSLVTVGRSLVAVRNWTFVLGPGFVVWPDRRWPPG